MILLFSVLTLILDCTKEKSDTDVKPAKKIDLESSVLEANKTIKELIDLYSGSYSIEDDVVIEGVVSSCDKAKNIYKRLFIQKENDLGIQILLDKSDLYKDYPFGKKVLLKCKGLKISQHEGLVQMGMPHNNGVRGIRADDISKYIVKLDGGGVPSPIVLDLDSSTLDIDTFYNKLVKVNNVQFKNKDHSKPYYFGNALTSNRELVTNTGNSIVVSTSQYAHFGKENTPSGSGNVSGILTRFDDTLQLMLMSLKDVNLSEERFRVLCGKGNGTLASPYDIEAARIYQGSGKAWVKAKIVGFIDSNIYYKGYTDAVNTNIAIAVNIDETESSNVLAVELNSKGINNILNLQANPNSLNTDIWLYGSLNTYCGMPGIKDVSKYSLDGIKTIQSAKTDIMKSELTNTNISFYVYNSSSSSVMWSSENGQVYVNSYGKVITESWMISKTKIDVSSFKNPRIFVEEYLEDCVDLDKVLVLGSSDYKGMGNYGSATWTKLVLDGNRSKGTISNNFTQFKVQKNMYLAFRYINTNDKYSCKWTIKTVKVQENTSEEILEDKEVQEGISELDTGSYSSGSIIKNGNFEEGWINDNRPKAWNKVENITKESRVVHGGIYSAKHVGGTKHLGQTVAVESGGVYTISFWYYIADGDGKDGRLWSFFKNSSGKKSAVKDPNNYLKAPQKNTWYQFTGTYTAPDSTTELYFELRTYKGATIYWDDISIVKN